MKIFIASIMALFYSVAFASEAAKKVDTPKAEAKTETPKVKPLGKDGKPVEQKK